MMKVVHTEVPYPQPSSDLDSFSGRELAQSDAFPEIDITKSGTLGH